MNDLKFDLDEMAEALDDSYNYDLIRRLAVDLYSHNNKISGISEKCKIIFNPYYGLFFTRKYDVGIERYFDFEIFDDELPKEEAIKYKKYFVKSLTHYYNSTEFAR